MKLRFVGQLLFLTQTGFALCTLGSTRLYADTLNLPPAIKHGCAAQLGEPRINILGGNAFGTNPSKEYYPNVYLPNCTPEVRGAVNKIIRFGQEACLGAYGIDLRRSSPDGVPRFAPDTMNDTIALAQIRDAMNQYEIKFSEVAEKFQQGNEVEKKCFADIKRFESVYAQSLNDELGATAQMIASRQTAEITANAPHAPFIAPSVPQIRAQNATKPTAKTPMAVTPIAQISEPVKIAEIQGNVIWSGDMSKKQGDHYFFFESSKAGTAVSRFYAGRLESYSPNKPISYNNVRAFESKDAALAEKIKAKGGAIALEKFVKEMIQNEDQALIADNQPGKQAKSKFGNYPIALVLNESFGFINSPKADKKVQKVAVAAPSEMKTNQKFVIKPDPSNPQKKYFIYEDPSKHADFIGAVDLDPSGKKVAFVRVYPISADDAVNYKKLEPKEFRVTWGKVKEEKGRAPASDPAATRPDDLIPSLEVLFK